MIRYYSIYNKPNNMKPLPTQPSDGPPNIHAIAFWITLSISALFFTILLVYRGMKG